MLPSSSFAPTAGFSLLLIGPPLTGKTNTAMLFPEPYFFDADDKLKNAVSRFPSKRFWYDNGYRDSSGLAIPPERRWVNAVERIKAAAISPEPKTLVVDSLTLLADFLQAHIINEMKSDPKALKVAGQQMMTLQYWGPFAQLMKGFIMLCKSTGKLLIFTVHEKAEYNDAGSVIGYKPTISGQLSDQLGALFTDVWRTETKQIYDEKTKQTGTRYYVRTAPSAMLSLGNSLGLPAEFDVTAEELSRKLSPAAPAVA